jgi:hypothetical protein
LLKLSFLNHNPTLDEAVYLGMGKYIYSQGNAGLWEMIRPLGLPLITGIWWKLGLDQLIVSRLFSILVSIGCIIFTFLITKKLFSNKHAIISALILACTPIFFFYSSYVLTDHIATLFLIASVFFLMKEKFILGGILGGCAIWFKFTHILYIGAIILFMAYKILILKNKKNILQYTYTLTIILLFIATYFLSNYILYHTHFNVMDAILKPYTDAAKYSNNIYQNTYFNSFSSFAYYVCYYIYDILFNNLYGFMIYLFIIIYIIHFIKFLKKENQIMIMSIFITYLTYFSFIPYKNERFEIFFLPIMAIYATYGIIQLIEYFYSIYSKKDMISNKTKSKYLHYHKKIISGIILIIIILLVFSFFFISINKISKFYSWKQYDEKLNYSIEKYIDIHNINGTILTTDPRFSLYSEKRYVGAYDVLNTNGLFVNEWESNANFSAIIYNNNSILCYDSDPNCISHKLALLEKINRDFVKKNSYIYHNSEIIFYIRK